jgi:hypothetical protein
MLCASKFTAAPEVDCKESQSLPLVAEGPVGRFTPSRGYSKDTLWHDSLSNNGPTPAPSPQLVVSPSARVAALRDSPQQASLRDSPQSILSCDLPIAGDRAEDEHRADDHSDGLPVPFMPLKLEL